MRADNDVTFGEYDEFGDPLAEQPSAGDWQALESARVADAQAALERAERAAAELAERMEEMATLAPGRLRPWPPEDAELVIEGVVLGDAKTAGSKVSGVVRKRDAHGRWVPVQREGGRGFKTFTKEDDSSGGKGAWREDVRAAVLAVFGAHRELLDGPLALELVVFRRRPRSHYGSGRNQHMLKPSAPRYPVSASGSAGGDVSKLARAFEDALNKLVWADDGQITSLRVEKDYTDTRPRAEYRLWVRTGARRGSEERVETGDEQTLFDG